MLGAAGNRLDRLLATYYAVTSAEVPFGRYSVPPDGRPLTDNSDERSARALTNMVRAFVVDINADINLGAHSCVTAVSVARMFDRPTVAGFAGGR